MKRSAERILTTHTGSLPRPAPLREALGRLDRGLLAGADADRLPALVARAVADIVPRQVDAGIDVVNDGELGKVSYARYAARRLSGFGGRAETARLADLEDFPGWRDRILPPAQDFPGMPACTGPVRYTGTAEAEADIANLLAATRAHAPTEAFLSAVSPGVLALFFQNRFYATQEEYLFALADAMKHEYDAISAAGLLLQVDCPDLARGRHEAFADLSDQEWRRQVGLHLQALEHAIRDIPADRIRMHVCWGNYEGPHHRDVPLRDVLKLVLGARPAAIAFEAANPRHEHEWRVFEDLPLPDGKVLIPGVIDSTTNYVEHPELVAQRLLRFTRLVGTERVIAGTDCGFATGASTVQVDPDIAWAKLRTLADGARLASRASLPGSREAGPPKRPSRHEFSVRRGKRIWAVAGVASWRSSALEKMSFSKARLSRAIGHNEAGDLPGPDHEGHAVQRHGRAKMFTYPADLDRCLCLHHGETLAAMRNSRTYG